MADRPVVRIDGSRGCGVDDLVCLLRRNGVQVSEDAAVTLVHSCTESGLRECLGRLAGGRPVAAICCEQWRDPGAIVRALESGIDEFLSWPGDEVATLARVQRLLSAALPARAEGLVGESAPFAEAVAKLPALAACDAPVLISGETGTGKELFARAIHYLSARRAGPFVPVNCGALPDLLFENELFGHARGAYTDARTSQQGLAALAHKGTLFLDEVDALSAAAQVKLLRFLQDREYRPLGASRTVKADVRILAATNSDVRKLLQTGAFRDDLFHRLNVLALRIPLLRDRIDDVPRLAAHFLGVYGLKLRRGKVRLSAAAAARLMAYSWPGNVRELEGVIHRAVALTRSPVLEAGDLDLPSAAAPPASGFRQTKEGRVAEFERSYLVQLMTEHHGNITHAARAAGKDRRALQRLIRKHALDRAQFA